MRSRIAEAVTAVAALALLTACSSAAGGAGGDDAGTAATAAATAVAAGTDASQAAQAGSGAGQPAGKTIKVCDVLSVGQTAKITGQPYTVAVPETADWTSRCAYNDADSTTEGVNVSFSNVNAENTWNVVHNGTITDISGLGDKAFWDNDNTLYVLSGSDLIQVNGLSSQQESEALARPVLDALH